VPKTLLATLYHWRPMQTPEITPTRIKAYVGGWIDADEEVEIRDPADQRQVVATVPRVDLETLSDAVDLAAEAASGWRRTSALERGAIIDTAADLIAARRDQIARSMTLETGRILPESEIEVQRTVEILRFFAQAPKLQDGRTFPVAGEGGRAFTMRLPLGVVALITPWNFPVMIPAWKLAPALAFGNAVILKPAEIAPMSVSALVEAMVDAGLPPGVLGFVPGRGSVLGPELVASEKVQGISFTGSTEVGLGIAREALVRGKRVQCEMGGRNAIVVRADADLEAALKGIMVAGFGASGQRCTSASRVIVERGIAAELRERIVAATAAMRLGPGLDPSSDIGPVISTEQLDGVRAALERGRGEGTEILQGGGRPAGDLAHGLYLEPTVTGGIEGTWFADHEIFGPVVSLFEVDDLDHAIALNNSVPFGLSSAIYTSDFGAAMRFIEETDTGMVHVNRPTNAADAHIPFGGAKESSSGPPEMGDAWQFYTRSRSAYLKW
jgi:alpha-ketoglutaric semialdehyde dehydrogenase